MRDGSEGPHLTAQDTTAAVEAFMARLEHPLKGAIERLRAVILGSDPSIAEGVKWNAPSFRTRDYFATLHLRGKGVGVVLHCGVKSKPPAQRLAVQDETRMLDWLALDRAMVRFADEMDVDNRRAPFQCVLRSWVARIHA
ncbi:DUF1801 domain-containing protein [Pseudofulvimonas gallinarii]|nr:DUF1801 domain-containing protein [Pseudofulvimonas gallinarii]THD15145.1 hypothetical protein B1808_01785 [Pseudofulvimonas gallinarii]